MSSSSAGWLIVALAGCGRIDFDPIDAIGPDAVVQLAVGGRTSCARLADGDVWCWGSGVMGALGDGGSVDAPLPQRVETPSAVADLDVNDGGACGRLAVGGAIGWGANISGQLGTGSTSIVPTPVAIPDTADAASITMGGDFLCALRSDGTVACAGAAAHLGDGSATDRGELGPVPSLLGVTAIAAGDVHAARYSAMAV